MITVLLAEDNDSVAKSIRRYLEFSNFKVLRAKDGNSAVQKAIENKPDIIVMDYQMPKLDGLEATKQIRAHPDITDTPIIVATGLALPNDSDRFTAAGANVYISKPYRMHDLVSHIVDLSSSTSRSSDRAES